MFVGGLLLAGSYHTDKLAATERSWADPWQRGLANMTAVAERCSFQFPVPSALINCNRLVTTVQYSSQNANIWDLEREY